MNVYRTVCWHGSRTRISNQSACWRVMFCLSVRVCVSFDLSWASDSQSTFLNQSGRSLSGDEKRKKITNRVDIERHLMASTMWWRLQCCATRAPTIDSDRKSSNELFDQVDPPFWFSSRSQNCHRLLALLPASWKGEGAEERRRSLLSKSGYSLSLFHSLLFDSEPRHQSSCRAAELDVIGDLEARQWSLYTRDVLSITQRQYSIVWHELEPVEQSAPSRPSWWDATLAVITHTLYRLSLPSSSSVLLFTAPYCSSICSQHSLWHSPVASRHQIGSFTNEKLLSTH